eukprot:NODE_4360_length_800_cov_20.084695_g4202_i0.p1 GENE.NODE_4360_length_800_cov_20.084695_g4202_i0~~NODE_4360_length_800_cov_20.084695_g4202_i0.p1  ORF type:complete len:220 (+),score=30.47 NODE_4360_length_800_cov_20.084695_g4202_i0:72-731(+)
MLSSDAKRRCVSGWDSEPSEPSPSVQIPSSVADVIRKVAFFVARCGDHLELMTCERRKDEPRLSWLAHKDSVEYVYYRTQLRDIRNKLKTIQEASLAPIACAGDDHHVTKEKLDTLEGVAMLDAIYTHRDEERRDKSAKCNQSDGHHLQDFIPDDVMATFLQKSEDVLQNNNPEATGLMQEDVCEPNSEDDIYSLYKKRMMLAYKYRPNPLGNPRTPYY